MGKNEKARFVYTKNEPVTVYGTDGKVVKPTKSGSLRSKLIRLAHTEPKLRPHLLPMLKRSSGKSLRVFDFDDTLVSSPGSVTIHGGDGEDHKINSETFAYYQPSPGDKIDFGAFNDVENPRIIKANFDRLKEYAADKNNVVTILTARPKGSADAVSKFLEAQGIKGVEVVALQSSDPYDKARWIDKKVEEAGIEDVEFYDDSSRNAKAVAEHGEKHKAKGVKFKSVNTPHPKETDYAGPVITKTFKSDKPTVAISEIPKKDKGTDVMVKPRSPAKSEWWEGQTPDFQHHYCQDHEHSKYCKAGCKMASTDNGNDKLVKDIGAAAKSASPKVKTYLLQSFIPKVEQAGPSAGIWLEYLERHFDKLKPEGALKGFTPADFKELKSIILK